MFEEFWSIEIITPQWHKIDITQPVHNMLNVLIKLYLITWEMFLCCYFLFHPSIVLNMLYQQYHNILNLKIQLLSVVSLLVLGLSQINIPHTQSSLLTLFFREFSHYVAPNWTQWIRDCSCLLCLSERSAITALKYSAICNKHSPIQLMSCFEPVNMVLKLKCLNSGENCVSHFRVSHFWCRLFKEAGPSIQQEGIPSSSDINNIPRTTPV